MSQFQSIDVHAPADLLFALTQDYQLRLEWDPFLKSAELLNGAVSARVGVRALCIAHNGMAMETEYLSFNPPNACAVKMTRGPYLIRDFAGSWRFNEVSPGLTQVRFRYAIKVRPRVLSWLFTPIIRWYFGRESAKRLEALKQAVERDSLIPENGANLQQSNTFRKGRRA